MICVVYPEGYIMFSRSPLIQCWDPPFVQWVVKVSKLCNLRCKYCYEYPFLGDAKRMEHEQLEHMFRHIADYYKGSQRRMDFVWHGGEPLLLKREFYLRMEEIQHEVFDPVNIPFTNSIQTNLAKLNNDCLSLLKTFFKHVGVSIDLFGDQRVNANGISVQEDVLRNMQRLKDEGVRFGCIVVLSRETAPYIEEIYHFFEEIDTSFRMLPIYRTGFDGQQSNLALSADEIVESFKKAVDLWFDSESDIQVRPIQDYITHALWHLDTERAVVRHYDKSAGEVVYIVDTDGSLYSNGDAYNPTLCHGNIFETPLGILKQSETYVRAVNEANSRIGATCHLCKFHGDCSGYFMAESTPEQRWVDALNQPLCGVAKPIQEYAEKLLIDAGFAGALMQGKNVRVKAASNFLPGDMF